MPRVIHFEISAGQPDRAVSFYSKVFGWEIIKWNGPMDYWLATTGPSGQPGIDGAIMKGGDLPQPVINTIDVPSVEEYCNKIIENGGTVLLPKFTVQAVGYMAYCRDTEGNIFGIMQEDSSAGS